jgi:hypothetical protein
VKGIVGSDGREGTEIVGSDGREGTEIVGSDGRISFVFLRRK